MMTSALSPTVIREAAVRPGEAQQIGSIAVRWKADEPLFLGGVAGPVDGFDTLQDAIRGAAGLSQSLGSSTMAVLQRGERFQAHELLQPVWKGGVLSEKIASYSRSMLQPLRVQQVPGPIEIGFTSLKAYNNRHRTGQLELDTRAGIAAIVGSDWAIVDEQLQYITPSRPTPPVDPKPPVDPTPPAGRTLVADVTEAARLANESLRIIGTVPPTDSGDESSKEVRIKAYKTNMAAQSRLEGQFEAGNPSDVLSTLRSADASLEDANWQLAKKPSPDGRFNGVDVPGALRDTQRAVDLLGQLLEQLTVAPAAA